MTGTEGLSTPETAEMHFEQLRGLSLGEVYGLVGQYAGLLAEVGTHYPGMKDRFLGPDDQGELYEVIGDLLPLRQNGAVQAEIQSADPQADASGMAFNRIMRLRYDILDFMAAFENTGVTVVYPDEGYLY